MDKHLIGIAQQIVAAQDRLHAVKSRIDSEYRDWSSHGGSVVELKRRVKGLRITKAKTRHGEAIVGSVTAEYKIWRGMLGRCLNKTNPAWMDYGGRGIGVCDRWRSFENFLADMGRRPDGLSLDRIDNNKGYSPDNCRWATRKEQARNRRSSAMIEYKGECRALVEWAEITGISVSAITQRLRAGWDVEMALTVPQRHRRRCLAEIEGRTLREEAA